MFDNAPKVSGGFGEKLLQKMGWKDGDGLGRGKGGTTEPIKFSSIKTDRKGLSSTTPRIEQEKVEVVKEEEEEMSWSRIKAMKEVDRSDPRAVFSQMKSDSFWSWHDEGMVGPQNVHQRLRQQKKEAKARHTPAFTVEGKHPVSGLAELCQRRGWASPSYTSLPPTAGGSFLLQVEVNGTSYTPPTSSSTKKAAKAEASECCLRQLGLLKGEDNVEDKVEDKGEDKVEDKA